MSAYRYRVAEAMTAAREAAGVSQRELADRLGRDKRTIQKWEKGEMKIALEDFLAVFDALKVQVEPYSKWIRHPELFPNGLSDILQYSTDKKRAALGDFYRCQASPMEVEQEYYFLYADHGSDYHGMYQQWMANLLTPLRDRRPASVPRLLRIITRPLPPGPSPTRTRPSPTWRSCRPAMRPAPRASRTALTATRC